MTEKKTEGKKTPKNAYKVCLNTCKMVHAIDVLCSVRSICYIIYMLQYKQQNRAL